MERSSSLQYNLYIYRMELRRPGRREDILRVTKATITEYLIMNNSAMFNPLEQEQAVQLEAMELDEIIENNEEIDMDVEFDSPTDDQVYNELNVLEIDNNDWQC